ncbi:MAG: AAA family ATPase [Lachnospiraceae bacterium]|nr:AAA family ATPase [Lachnospiraceae bacterium]
MKLLELHIDGFGKFHDCTVSFQDGVNVIYGNNEAGKSTLHTFIRAMLFGIERGRGRAARNDVYSRYEPWENSASYAGWLRLESAGTVYRIERRFQKDNKSLKIINETRQIPEEPTKALWETLLGGLNETTYTNTISISQLKSATDDGMVGELKNYIANMNTTGNLSLNITKATAFLKNQKRSLEADLIPDASRDYTALLSEIRSIDAELSAPEYENQLTSYQAMRTEVKGQIERTQAEKQVLEDKVSRAKLLLAESRFADQAAVETCKKTCKETFDTYQNALGDCRKKSRRILSVLDFLLAAGGLYTAWYLSTIDFRHFLPVCIACAAAAVGCFILGIVFVRQEMRSKATFSKAENMLAALFGQHLGDPSISADAYQAFQKRMAEFSRLCQVVLQSEETLKNFTGELLSLQEKQSSCGEMIEKQQKNQWELEKKIEYLSGLKSRAAALKRVLAENDRIREEITAIETARETLAELSTSIQDSFGFYLNKEASGMIFGITGGTYDSMSVDENLDVYINTRTKLVPLGSVSSGTIDQVYLALRLSAARLLQGDGEQLPLIFDDSFTQYDNDRLRSALKWLATSYKGQLLLFTCQRREADLLKEEKLPFHYVEIGL